MECLNNKKFLRKRNLEKATFFLLIIFVFELLFFPFPALADLSPNDAYQTSSHLEISIEQKQSKIQKLVLQNQKRYRKNSVEEKENIKEKKQIVSHVATTTVTAYNSEVAQCDSQPCITANGFNVCAHGIEDTIAANHLPFGTKVRIPNFFGEKVFVVRDRMNPRYKNRIDVWMLKKSDAVNFGVKIAKIEVIK